MADATPFVTLPADADAGIVPAQPAPMTIGGRAFAWGSRTFLMGIINLTPDSFSGDGLLATGRDGAGAARNAALALGRRMADEGADLLDLGGESTRPGHADIDAAEELRRVMPALAAIHAAIPDLPLSIDSRRPAVVAAALAAGASLVNDVAAVSNPSDAVFRVAAEHGVPIVLMHDRPQARYRNVVAEVLADLQRAVERAVAAGVPWQRLIVDPGMGFGKTAAQNLALLRGLGGLRVLGRPILLGMSRKSTIGRLLDLPAPERLEGTLATTALGIAAGVDIVRVHDVEANRRVALVSDAIVRPDLDIDDRPLG
ncbi:MAG: dihydropteroate synthase [Candidatus Limnocylindrales bacterium]